MVNFWPRLLDGDEDGQDSEDPGVDSDERSAAFGVSSGSSFIACQPPFPFCVIFNFGIGFRRCFGWSSLPRARGPVFPVGFFTDEWPSSLGSEHGAARFLFAEANESTWNMWF
jgi:hypothetical protein